LTGSIHLVPQTAEMDWVVIAKELS
jgi:hypothetical protein